MRELDVLLSRFLDERYIHSSRDTQLAFSKLLDQEDDQLWDWLLGRSEPSDQELLEIVRQIGQLNSS